MPRSKDETTVEILPKVRAKRVRSTTPKRIENKVMRRFRREYLNTSLLFHLVSLEEQDELQTKLVKLERSLETFLAIAN